MQHEVFEFFGRPVSLGALMIPIFAGMIGWGTNWVAIKMMFLPIEWVGWKLPFKLGIGRYKFPVLGWQGVIPSKAPKMGSLAVDTGLAKLGTLYEFFQAFEPEEMGAHLVANSREEIHALVDDIAAREYPQLWAAAPARIRQMVHRRVESETPAIVTGVLEDIGRNIDRLLDLKLMVIRHLQANPRLINRIFLEVGANEFRFIVNAGGWMGFLLGLGPMVAWVVAPQWWTVPVGAAIVGYLTNFIALKVIFEPLEPTRVGPLKLHGLFLRRQPEVAEEYARIIAYEIVTLPNIARAMLYGPDGDRTRALIARTLGPVVDDAVGLARPAMRTAGRHKYESIKESVAEGAVNHTVGGLLDEDYGRDRAAGLRRLLERRMKALSYPEFARMLRSAFEQDEWMLISVGALLGFAAGAVQLVLTL